MHPTELAQFAGLRLHARASDRRPRRRTVAWPLVALIIAVSVIAGSNVAKRADSGTGMVAGLTVCAAATVIWLICRLAAGRWSRNRLTILDRRFGDSGDVVFAIRSTASFDRFAHGIQLSARPHPPMAQLPARRSCRGWNRAAPAAAQRPSGRRTLALLEHRGDCGWNRHIQRLR